MKKEKQQKTGSRNPIKAALAKSLQDRVRKYRSQKEAVRAFVARDPSAPIRQQDADRQAVASEVQRLESLFEMVLPYVRRIRARIADLTDQSRLVACYLLFGKIAQSTRAILQLAKDGFHYEVMELVRSNREALDLVTLFLREESDGPLLRKWFAGEIVENEKARKVLTEWVSESSRAPETELPVGEMKAGVYGGLSKYTHVSYAALLDSYDVHHDDFDFERFAGYHYVRGGSLPYVKGEFEAIIIGLKDFYVTTGDRESYDGLDALLREHAPHMYDRTEMARRIGKVSEKYPGLI